MRTKDKALINTIRIMIIFVFAFSGYLISTQSNAHSIDVEETAQVVQMNFEMEKETTVVPAEVQCVQEQKQSEKVFVWPSASVSKEYFYDDDIPMSKDWQEYAWNESIAAGISPYFVYAVCQKESGWDPEAVSYDGHDYGLMQIRDINHSSLKSALCVEDFLNPYDNVKAGIYMLSQLIPKYNDPSEVLMAYNYGPSIASKKISKGITHSDYSIAVISIYEGMTCIG